MFPNLNAEIARKGFTQKQIVDKLKDKGFNITVPMLSLKLSGKYELYFKEAKALKEIVETDIPLDVLFEEAI